MDVLRYTGRMGFTIFVLLVGAILTLTYSHPQSTLAHDVSQAGLVALHSGKCMDVTDGSVQSGATIIQWTCDGAASQQEQITDYGSGWHEIRFKHSDMCLDVPDGSAAWGLQLQQAPCSGGDNQRWTVASCSGCSSVIQSKINGLCADVAGGSYADGASVIQWECHGADNQAWQMREAFGPNGVAIDIGDVTGNSSTALGTANDCFGVASGAAYTLDVVLQDVSNVAAAQLTLTYAGSVADRTVGTEGTEPYSILSRESPDVGGSAVTDAVSAVPDFSGAHVVIVSNDAAIGSGGASGSGILIRFTMTAPTVSVPTDFALGLTNTVLDDPNANEIANVTYGATLRVGGVLGPCGVDSTPPVSSIDSGPANPTNATSASFAVSATDPVFGGFSSGVNHLECQLDGAGFTTCASPQSYSGLGEGAHTFGVRALDNAGNVGSPASFPWVIDLSAAVSSIDGGPAGPINATSASFTFHATDPVSGGVSSGVNHLECQLDSGGFATCTSPQSYSGLGEGTHTFGVRAVDNAGNVESTPQQQTFEVTSPAFEAASTCTPASASNFSWSHTVGSGPNRLLLVGVSIRKDGVTLPTVSTVTYAGLALTKVGSVANGTNVRAELWRLINPPAVTSDVVVTLSAAANAVCGATSWTGVNQGTPLGSAVTATGNSTTPSKAVTSATGQVVHDVLASKSSETATVGAGQSERWNDSVAATVRGAGSTEPGAASVTMSWTLGSAQPWAILAVPIKPAPAFEAASLTTTTNSTTCTWSHTVGSGPNRLLLVGVSVRKDGVTLPTVSSVTYAGLSLTRVGTVANGSNVRAEMWRLVNAPNPPPGSDVVVVTLSAAANAVCAATSWTNVNQSTPLGSAVTATGNSTTPSKAVTSAVGQLVHDVLGATTDVAASIGAGQTQRWNGAVAATVRGAGSTEPGASTVTMSWTLGSAQPWAILAVPIKPP